MRNPKFFFSTYILKYFKMPLKSQRQVIEPAMLSFRLHFSNRSVIVTLNIVETKIPQRHNKNTKLYTRLLIKIFCS